MKITIFGLAITSSWGNGHASTFRSLCSALHARGHRIVFFEKNAEWYASNRALPHPSFCDVEIYDDWPAALPIARRHLRARDVSIARPYFLDGVFALRPCLDSAL